MSLIPNIFGENNDRYIGILPLSFWVYEFWSKHSSLSLAFSLLGIFSIVGQVYRDKLNDYIKHKKIKDARDFGSFILNNPILLITGIVFVIYFPFTIIYGIITNKDYGTYFLLVCNIVAFIYAILTLTLRKEFRIKIKEIVFFIVKRKKLLRRV